MASDEQHVRDAQALVNALGGTASSYVSDYIAHLEKQGDLQGLARWRLIAKAITPLRSHEAFIPDVSGRPKPRIVEVQ